VKPLASTPKITELSPIPKAAKTPKLLKKRKPRKSPRKIKNYEDDLEEDLERLKATGIRTKVHTRDLCRRMIQTTDLNTKQILAELLKTADTPCRRLFIDYRGLFILGNWITDLGWSQPELDLKIALEDALAQLAIPDKQVLTETKLWHTMTKWSTTSFKDVAVSTAASEVSSRTTSPTNTVSEANTPIKQPQDKVEEMPKDENEIEAKAEPPADEPMEVDDEVVEAIAEKIIQSETEKTEAKIVETLSSQKVEPQDLGAEKLEDSTMNEVEPITKKSEEASASSEAAASEIEAKAKLIQTKAIAILECWSLLQEVKFKIPKSDRAVQRALHEREVEAAEAERKPSPTSEAAVEALYNSHHSKPWSYYSSWGQNSRPDSPTSGSSNLVTLSGPIMKQQPRKRPRPSRFDDETGELHNPRIDRNALRHLFAKKAQQEHLEKVQRDNLFDLHQHKCQYLCLDPISTPLFPQFPEFYYNPELGQWYKLPPFEKNGSPVSLQLPTFHPKNYPRMANMPVEAFRDIDEPLPDPAKLYPPGVVPISYFFGPPMSLDPRYLAQRETLKLEQESMPINFIDPETGLVAPIPEMSPEEYEQKWAAKKAAEEEEEAAAAAEVASKLPKQAPFMLPDDDDDSRSGLPFLNGDDRAVEEDIKNLLDITDIPLPTVAEAANLPAAVLPPTTSLAANGKTPTTARKPASTTEVRVKLPPNWKAAKDAEGRTYYYNKKTKEVTWDPPEVNEAVLETVNTNGEPVEVETVSTASDENDDADLEEDGEDSDDEDEDDDDKEEEASTASGLRPELNSATATSAEVISDLSEQEKDVLLRNSRKKTKEERQHERRQKRERDRERREYEKKRRRERHGKHRRDGLVQEHFIPVSNKLHFFAAV
jgi:histone-lysine N-methyltransferase SETD2